MAFASSITLTTLIIFSVLTISHAASKLPKNTYIHLPIRKNQTTLQYYTTFDAAFPTTVDAVIALGAQSVWFDCASYNSSSYKRVSCGSNKCKKASDPMICLRCNGRFSPGCSNNTCGIYVYTVPLHQEYLTSLELGEDTIRVSSTDGYSVLRDYDVPKFQFACDAYNSLATNLPLPGDDTHTKGVVGLARNDISLTSQISSAFSLAKKFALCIPSSSENGLGDIFIGGGPYFMPPSGDLSSSLVRTPLVFNPVSTAPSLGLSAGDPSDEYFINVKDIEIDGKRVVFDSSLLSFNTKGVGGTKISTVEPYTTLHSTIYKRLVKDFVKAAAARNIVRVKSVAPFGACFDSKAAPRTITGPAVPEIDLVLEGKDIRFRVHGSNSMVEVKKNVMCLAVVDGGAEPRTSIVLGGHQLENRLLEFDLDASKLGFTQSLLLSNTSCSHYRLF